MSSINNIASTNAFMLNQLCMLFNMGMIKGCENAECFKAISSMTPCEIERLGSQLGDSFINIESLILCLGERSVDIPEECKALLVKGASNDVIQQIYGIGGDVVKLWRADLNMPSQKGRIRRVLEPARWPLWNDWVQTGKSLTPEVLIELADKYESTVAGVWYEIITVAKEKESQQ